MIRVLLFALVCHVALSQDLMSPAKTMTKVWSFYREPSFDLLTNIIRSIDAEPGFPNNKDRQSPTLAFFAVAFERYPDKLNSINSLSDSLKNIKKLVQGCYSLEPQQRCHP